MAPLKTLIIGAGPGGLGLAQLLRAKDLPYEIFERDATPSARQQGWAVALVECLDEFEANLPKDLGELHTVSVNHGIAPYDSIGVYDGRSNKMIAGIGAVPRGQPGYMLRANRAHFRAHLFQNLPIQFGKEFLRYEQDADGVTVHFKDGSSAHGDLLVAADGAHSRVRRQLLGAEGARMIPSQFVPMIQELELTREQYGPIRAYGTSAVVAGRDRMSMLVGMLEAFDGGERARYYTATSFKSDDPVTDAAWARDASKDDLYNRVVAETEGLPAALTDLIKLAGPQGMADAQISFQEFLPPDALPTGRVTLLGDAAHTMVPFRGAGANTAVADACLLARLLGEAATAGSAADASSVLRAYETKMLPRGREMVLASRAAGDSPLGPASGRQNNVDKLSAAAASH